MSSFRHYLSRTKKTLLRPFYLFLWFLPSHPISRNFGHDRGDPIDRYYIDRFLFQHRADITGNVLEIGDPGYTPKMGVNVSSLTVLHYEKKVYPQTIIGDLENHETLPTEKFDCFVCPQTYQYIYDFEKGLLGAFKMLKENGVFLATIPAVSQTSVGKDESWKEYWRFRRDAVERGFSSVFGKENIEVNGYGNIKVITSFLYGFSKQELSKRCFDDYDPDYPFIFTIRAVKRKRAT